MTQLTHACDDRDFHEYRIDSVTERDGGYVVSFDGGWALAIPKPAGFVPRAGMQIRIYGQVGSRVRGVFINGVEIYYRTREEDDHYWRKTLYGETAAEWVARWDNGNSIFSIAMGGLGPGYEQCIQVLAVEIVRDALGIEAVFDGELGREFFNTSVERTLSRCNKHLHPSGAQVSAARQLAWNVLEHGPMRMFEVLTGTIDVGSRIIQISNRWPRVPAEEEATSC